MKISFFMTDSVRGLHIPNTPFIADIYKNDGVVCFDVMDAKSQGQYFAHLRRPISNDNPSPFSKMVYDGDTYQGFINILPHGIIQYYDNNENCVLDILMCVEDD